MHEQSLARQLLSEAESAVKEGAGKPGFKPMVHKLPALIMTSGLPQALSYLKSQTGEGERLIYDRLSSSVLSSLGIASGKVDLLREVLAGDGLFLRIATRESMRFAKWLRIASKDIASKDTTSKDIPSKGAR